MMKFLKVATLATMALTPASVLAGDALEDSRTLFSVLELRVSILELLDANIGHPQTTATHMEHIVLRPIRAAMQEWSEAAVASPSGEYANYASCHTVGGMFATVIETTIDQLRKLDFTPVEQNAAEFRVAIANCQAAIR